MISIPLLIEAGDPGFPGCNPEVKCARWATGKLVLKPGPESMASATLTAVGCAKPCDKVPTVTRTDRDAIYTRPNMPGQEADPLPAERARAHAELALKALQLWDQE